MRPLTVKFWGLGNVARDQRLDNDEDFIVSQKYENSLKKILEDYPDGVPPSVICKVMCITPEQLDTIMKSAMSKLRSRLVEEEDDEV